MIPQCNSLHLLHIIIPIMEIFGQDAKAVWQDSISVTSPAPGCSPSCCMPSPSPPLPSPSPAPWCLILFNSSLLLSFNRQDYSGLQRTFFRSLIASLSNPMWPVNTSEQAIGTLLSPRIALVQYCLWVTVCLSAYCNSIARATAYCTVQWHAITGFRPKQRNCHSRWSLLKWNILENS